MDIRKVKKLIELLEESGIDELEIKEGEESVRISRHSKQPAYAPQPVYAQAPAPAASQRCAVSTSSASVVGSCGQSALVVSAPVGATVISRSPMDAT